MMQCHASACLLLSQPRHGTVGASIAQHSTLPLFLARQLVEHSLPAALAALESAAAEDAGPAAPLPVDSLRELVVGALTVLTDGGMQTTVQPYLQRQQSAVLHLAHRLVGVLPPADKTGAAPATIVLWRQAATLLANASMGPASQQATEAQAQAAAWTVMQCLPRLAAGLPMLQFLSDGSIAEVVNALSQLLLQPYQISGIGSHHQLTQLLEGADAALRISAALAPSLASQYGAAEAASLPAITVANCAQLAFGYVIQHPSADLVAAAPAAVQLHANGCRLLHQWAAAGAAHGPALQVLHDGTTDAGMTATELLQAAQRQGEEGAAHRWAGMHERAVQWDCNLLCWKS